MEKTIVKTNIEIPPYAKVKVYWSDKPENYSREGKSRVKSHFAKKYGVARHNINVVFRPVKIDSKGNLIEITDAGIENIMDTNYQRSLMKEWLEREGKEIDFGRLVKLDNKVNGSLQVETDARHRTWKLKWVTMNNFLCFGDKNFVHIDKLKGITVVNSEPANQGGKTSFSVDSIKFLLFGTTTKTTKNEQVFNTYREENEVLVRGLMEIEGEEFVIERKLRRSAKRAGGWTVNGSVNYYRLMPDGEEKPMNDEESKETTKAIRNTIGKEDDFEVTVLATARNLEDLIETKPTERGKLLTRFIGLEVIEQKEKIAREMHNEFTKKMVSNTYDIITLRNEIGSHEAGIETLKGLKLNNEGALVNAKQKVVDLTEKKVTLVSSKKQVDDIVKSMNPTKIEDDIDVITRQGVKYKNAIDEFDKQIKELSKVSFNEDEYFQITKEYNELFTSKKINEGESKRLGELLIQLKEGEICPTCRRPLDDVDHSDEIAKNQTKLDNTNNEIELQGRKLDNLNEKIDNLNETKKKIDELNRVELSKARAEVEIKDLRVQLKDKNGDLKKYEANLDAIEHNIKVDSDVSMVATEIIAAEHSRDELIRTIQKIEDEINQNLKDITDKEKLIDQIAKEDEVNKIFKVYIDLVGKKGISKLVLRSVLPIINSELQRLLEDCCDFEVELDMNDKNDVEFILSKDGVNKLLQSGSGLERTASALALRAVLGKMSSLPMPNFIQFDEVLGKVHNTNIEKMKPLFDKIGDMYDIVFLITHNDLVKDWGSNFVTVKKEKNVSSIYVK